MCEEEPQEVVTPKLIDRTFHPHPPLVYVCVYGVLDTGGETGTFGKHEELLKFPPPPGAYPFLLVRC